MSCETNSNKIGKLAGLRSGLTALGSKAGNVAGGVIGRWAQAQDIANQTVLRRVAPLSNRLLQAVDRPTVTMAKAAPLVLSLLAATRWRGYALTQPGGPPVLALAATLRPAAEMAQNQRSLNTVQKGLGLVGLASGLTATLATQGTQDKADRRTLELKEKDKVVAAVTFQPLPKLTGFLNKRDLIGAHRLGQGLVSSEGEVVKGRGLTRWHRGTSVIKVNGLERTITHLQSLRLPSQHLYFNRALSEAEVAGLVAGRVQAHKLPGYAGEVQPLESLTPLWAASKQGLILTSLYWPTAPDRWTPAPQSAKPVSPKAVKPATAVAFKADNR